MTIPECEAAKGDHKSLEIKRTWLAGVKIQFRRRLWAITLRQLNYQITNEYVKFIHRFDETLR